MWTPKKRVNTRCECTGWSDICLQSDHKKTHFNVRRKRVLRERLSNTGTGWSVTGSTGACLFVPLIKHLSRQWDISSYMYFGNKSSYKSSSKHSTKSSFDNIITFTGCQDNGQPASWCLANKEILEKVFKQHTHWYFFISEWVWRWARRLDRSAKARLQWRHENGFSPVEETQGFGSVRIIARDCSVISFLMIVLLFLYIKKNKLFKQENYHLSAEWRCRFGEMRAEVTFEHHSRAFSQDTMYSVFIIKVGASLLNLHSRCIGYHNFQKHGILYKRWTGWKRFKTN